VQSRTVRVEQYGVKQYGVQTVRCCEACSDLWGVTVGGISSEKSSLSKSTPLRARGPLVSLVGGDEELWRIHLYTTGLRHRAISGSVSMRVEMAIDIT
jgi:hypothetical protein